ncbi:MAG TPA: hypothetical protein V6D21_25255, partial [Candidatus Obscuribacterales bacterium]
QQLVQEITISNNSELNPSNSLVNEVKKTFNVTPAVPGSGYTDTAINHDQILANTLLGES